MGDAAVIGGGLLGLAVAQRLRDRGDDVTVFERKPVLGGWGWGEAVDEPGAPTWDGQDHMLWPGATRTRRLITSLGLGDELRWVPIRSCLYAGPDRSRRSLSSRRDLVRLSGVGPLDKVRIALTMLLNARGDVLAADGCGAREWFERRSGARAVAGFWSPVLRAQLGERWGDAPAGSVRVMVRQRMGRRSRAHAQPQIGYVPGGYGGLLDRYAEALADSGVKINLGATVRHVVPFSGRLEVQLSDSSAEFDRVVVTAPAPEAAELCPTLTSDERARLAGSPYLGTVCAVVRVPARVSRYFVTCLLDPAAPFDAVVEPSNLVGPSRQRAGVVYLPRHVAPEDPLLSAPDEDVAAEFLAYLRGMAPKLSGLAGAPVRITRQRHAIALPGLGTGGPTPSTCSVAGLQLLGASNLRFGSLGIDEPLALLQELR